MKIVALAGGVGGAKLVWGLAQTIKPTDFSVVVNTGDDFDHLGLRICPDIDTVCYTLAGIANPETGWGQKNDTLEALKVIEKLGGPDWFQLGDKDLGTHLVRTTRLRAGEPLSAIVADFSRRWGSETRVFPMTDDDVRTKVVTQNGEVLEFQEYFVKHQCRRTVKGFRFEHAANARPAPGVLEAINGADCVVICPSNPWVSIDPILSIPGVREAVENKIVISISPIIGGKAVKGPAAKMYQEMGITPSALAVAKHYGSLLTGFVLDCVDQEQKPAIERCGIMTYTTNTIMKDLEARKILAEETIKFCQELCKVG